MNNLMKAKKGKSSDIKSASISSKKGNKDIRVSVREIKNGYIINKSVDYKDKEGQWHYKNEEWYSKENPLEILGDKSLADLF